MNTDFRSGALSAGDGSANSLGTKHRESPWVWAAFAVLIILYVFSAWRTGPLAAFGAAADDALYFSSAKALAFGQGYILPGFPVRLKATKYPELYPLLLAGIWKIDPHFPGNVNLASGLTLALGCVALLFAFLLLRRWPGMDDWQALAVVALCAFTGYFLELSASVLTDIPFMALMLGALWMSEKSLDHAGRRCCWWAIAAGFLSGLAVGLRSIGVAVVAGIGLALLAKRDYRRLFWFSAAALPTTLLFLWPALARIMHPLDVQLALGPSDSGWTQTLCYYSGYSCNWRMNIQSHTSLLAVVIGNIKAAFQVPGFYLLSPLATHNGILSIVLVSLIGAATYGGMARHAWKLGWSPVLPVLLFYFLVIASWPYPVGRFLLIFFPIFLGLLWLEARQITTLVVEHLRPSHGLVERTVACLLAAGGIAVVTLLAVNYARAIPSELTALKKGNERLLRDEREAYAWIRKHAAPRAAIIAYEDGLAYLYTNHPAVIPIKGTTLSLYLHNAHYAERDADRLADVACHIHASYWLATAEDFHLDGSHSTLFRSRQAHLLASAPIVFQSADGVARLYDVRDVLQNDCGREKPKQVSGLHEGR